MLEYFKPLQDFLVLENQKLRNEDEFRQKLVQYNVVASTECRKLNLAKWATITDVNNVEKSDAYSKAVSEYAQFIKAQYNEHFRGRKPNDFIDEKIQRQILYLTNLDTNALNETSLNERAQAMTEMEKIYNNAEFCDYNKINCTKNEKLTLDPGMVNSIYILFNQIMRYSYLLLM